MRLFWLSLQKLASGKWFARFADIFEVQLDGLVNVLENFCTRVALRDATGQCQDSGYMAAVTFALKNCGIFHRFGPRERYLSFHHLTSRACFSWSTHTRFSLASGLPPNMMGFKYHFIFPVKRTSGTARVLHWEQNAARDTRCLEDASGPNRSDPRRFAQ